MKIKGRIISKRIDDNGVVWAWISYKDTITVIKTCQLIKTPVTISNLAEKLVEEIIKKDERVVINLK